MSQTPAQSSVSMNERAPFQDIRSLFTEFVTLDAATRDPANSPTTQLRRGLVVGKLASGKFIDAGNASPPAAHSASSVTSIAAPGASWQTETLSITVPGLGTIVHTFAASVTNLATAIADILANPAGSLVTPSDNGGGLLKLTANKPGVTLAVTSSDPGAFEAVGGVEVSDSSGELTVYGILRDGIPSMLGIADAAEDKNAHIATKRFVARESDIDNMTAQARQWFEANGVIFIAG